MAQKTTTKETSTKPKKVTHHVHAKAKDHVHGFVHFIRTQGVVGLAIGFIIGTQAKTLVDQMSSSFVNPILGLIVGSPEGLTGKTFYVTIGGRSGTFTWGAFVYALINFVIIAAIIYFTFRWLHLDKLDKKKD